MKEQGHKMLISRKAEYGPYLDRMADRAVHDPDDRIAVEAAALRSRQAASIIPVECGTDIAPSVARGGFVLHHNVELLPVGSDRVDAVHRGYGGRSAIKRADVFDVMLAAAQRRKQPPPLTQGQIAIGRRYHDLVEMLTADGLKLSSLQGSKGGSDGRDWMDRRLELSAEVDGMRRRIGVGPAMVVRRIRPSQRGAAGPKIFTRRDLVDAICLKGKSVRDALDFFAWSNSGRNCNAAIEALREALDAMIGYRPQKNF